MPRTLFPLVVALGLGTLVPNSNAQTPAPIIIQAITPAPAVAPPTPIPVVEPKGVDTLLALTKMKEANAETIKKQEAALATLDELQKAAEEIKIFSKRG